MKKLTGWLALGMFVAMNLLCGGDVNRFEANPFHGIRREFKPEECRLSQETEADGNKCLKFELQHFDVSTGKRKVHGALYLGRTAARPGEVFSYSLDLKGTLPFVFVSALEWDGPDFYRNLRFNPGLRYRRIELTEDWQTVTGTFTVGAGCTHTVLTVMLYEDERYAKPFRYREGQFALLDNVRVADSSGRNVFTHLSYVAPRSEETFVKSAGDYVILFKGNSITRHSVNAWTREKLGWTHVAGMAASAEEKDFAHVLQRKIQSVMPDRRVRIVFGSGNKHLVRDFETVKGFGPDLIVIQGGEHAVTPQEIGHYEAMLDGSIAKLKTLTPRVICVGVWESAGRDVYAPASLAGRVEAIQRRVSAKHGIPFVSVAELAVDSSCHGWGSSGGVRWHPNDKGMAGYALRIFEAWKKAYQKGVNE